MKHVLSRLQEYEKQASATEKNIIDYFLEKTEEAGELSIYEIAEKTYSSPSDFRVIRISENRFCTKRPCAKSPEVSKWRKSARRTAWRRSSTR